MLCMSEYVLIIYYLSMEVPTNGMITMHLAQVAMKNKQHQSDLLGNACGEHGLGICLPYAMHVLRIGQVWV